MKVIFLDIDGPMIPATSFIFEKNPSFGQVLDHRSVAILKAICEKSGAKVVLNTSHNRILQKDENSPGLLPQLEAAGLGDLLFKEDVSTQYPAISRLEAIEEWLSNHPEVTDWVALDDAHIDHGNAILVNPEFGIGRDDYNRCAITLGFKPCFVLL